MSKKSELLLKLISCVTAMLMLLLSFDVYYSTVTLKEYHFLFSIAKI
jgi:hypothetical protein